MASKRQGVFAAVSFRYHLIGVTYGHVDRLSMINFWVN
jgi:hypothetical protein